MNITEFNNIKNKTYKTLYGVDINEVLRIARKTNMINEKLNTVWPRVPDKYKGMSIDQLYNTLISNNTSITK